MNIIYFSPHFPDNFIEFAAQLRMKGATVLGIADAEYDNLSYRLKASLTEYYKVNSLEDYAEVFGAVAYFANKYGRINHLVSLSKFWIPTVAKLRSDFNIDGLNIKSINEFNINSLMQQKFINAGLNVALGKIIENIEAAKEFVKEVNYPIVAKSDIKKLDSLKINNEEELINFFDLKDSKSYFLEEFIYGEIINFDGLTDNDGNIVFYSSSVYLDENIGNQNHFYYYTQRQVPEDLEYLSRILLKQFNFKALFFHVEFVRTTDNKLIARNVNVHPHLNISVDMFNFANDINIYEQWANVIINNAFYAKMDRIYFVAFVARNKQINYENSIEQAIEYCGNKLVFNDYFADIFSQIHGNYGFIVRHRDLDELKKYVNFILKTC